MRDGAQPATALRLSIEPLAAELYRQSEGEKYGLESGEFARILAGVAQKYLPVGASEADIRELCRGLHVEELALARACAAGNERAWEAFLLRYREKLYAAALGITRDPSKAGELAGSIYGDLYGTASKEGERVSKLSYYNGRGSLEGWLRTVLAQRYVNEYRGRRHTVSLEEAAEEGKQFPARDAEPVSPVDPRLNKATDETLAALSHEDRCMLAYYFLDDRTLAEIACVLGVHESTISRKLEKLVKALRKDILARLMRLGMSARQAEEALEVDVRDMTLDIRRRLAQDSAGIAFSKEKAIRAGDRRE